MAAGDKRLDLRFGAFACSVQGFDDPVMPVQQILRAIQHLLEESPEIADAGISFDAETIESLVEEVSRRAEINMSDLEITPGLVIVYHGEGTVPALNGAAAADDQVEDAEASSPDESGSGETDDGAISDIFAARLRHSLNSDADADETGIEGHGTAVEANGGSEVSEAAVQGGDDASQTASNIFAAPADDDGGIFHDPMAMAERESSETADDAGESGDVREQADKFEPSGINLFGNYLVVADSGEVPAAEVDDDDEAPLELGPAMEAPAGGDDDPHSVAGLAKLAKAEGVPDKILSAAAWIVLLKGQTTFSRREVLEAFDKIPGDHQKTLEARIKGFGKVVRDRNIVMVEDGVFRLSSKVVERFQALL